MRHTLTLSAVALLLVGPARAADVDFARDVRPILARHCFKCHGPDEGARKAKLRLDLREVATAEGRSGQKAIVPGKPDESEAIRRIFSAEGDVMPPVAAKLPLSEADRQTLKKWVASGAEYRPHWAFAAPVRPPLPKVKQSDWPRNPIDNFILSRLERERLQPSPTADRYTLVRRVYLDLIGLPPTPEEADAFVNDRAPDAYEKLVDRLLASRPYGERWARRWLDLARYADTNGYEKDRPRSIWPYRDWVINALNADMPFDRFTVEQIAGDMLPNATPAQRIATGFHRNTMTNEEGGIDPLEFRFHAVTDRVATTGTVWLGLTVGCAQCHTHKYDPIPHREYYQLLAFLNNADEPELPVPQPDLEAKRKALEAEVRTREVALASKFPPEPLGGPDDTRTAEQRSGDHLKRRFEAWLKDEAERAVRWTVLRPTAMQANLPRLTLLDDGSVLVGGDQTKHDTYELTFEGDLRDVTALRLEALPHDSLPARGPGRAYYEGPKGDFFLSELTLTADRQALKLGGASETYGKLGIGGGKAGAVLCYDGVKHSGWSTNGREGQEHNAVFNLAEPLRSARSLKLNMLFDRHYAAGLGRFRVAVTSDARAVKARDLPADVEDLLLVPAEQRTAAQRDRLLQQFLAVAPELEMERKEIAKLRQQMPRYPTTLVMQERPADNPRPTTRHHRGEFLQPRERVEAAVPSFLPPLPSGTTPDRLRFARWLVDARNPLVGRVTMNRQWAAFFGRGIVRTTEDFGFQGEPPTHPELLDWLAVEFAERKWSLKQMHRLIVTSATYQQASRVTPGLLKRDPDNRLLGRGPRVRLEAELIRDAALKRSGLLSNKIGGPSVFPPQPAGVTTEGAYGRLDWKVSEGEDRYRRGLYTFSKRTTPYAMFTTFDAPSGEACVARREVSNTPLQALTLLNDAVFVEAARELGRRTAAQPGTDEQRAADLFRRCLVRPPRDEERTLVVDYFGAQKKRLEAKELDAAALAGPGESSVERAAWALTARSLLNLDEAITKD